VVSGGESRPSMERREFVSYSLMDIEGIGPLMAAKLKTLGIRTTESLLETAKNVKGRKALAAKIGVDEKTVLKWANMADRMRIKGVGEDYAELLQAAGVDTVRELKYRNVGNLAKAMAKANRERKLVSVLPSEGRVKRWIEQAKSLPVKISY
jgi:predicted flap endonuclease-1-like 5' DNA nuclease